MKKRPISEDYSQRAASNSASSTDNPVLANEQLRNAMEVPLGSSKTILPDSEQERKKTLEEIAKSYSLGLKYYTEEKFQLAEKELVKVLKPTLSKSLMKNLYVNTEDVDVRR